jgi:biopolymer transport protein ExbD
MKRTFLARAAVFVLPLVVFLLFAYNIWQDLDFDYRNRQYLDFDYRFGLPARILKWILLSIVVGRLATLLRDRARGLRRNRSASQTPRMLLDLPLRASLPLRLPRLAPANVDLPNFGMYCGWILGILMFFFMIFLAPGLPMGLMVRLPSRYFAALPRAPESESLGVYVSRGGQFYVNGQLVPRERLRMKLQGELSRRVLWVIYFEADDDAAYGQVVYAVDAIQGLGAQAYWITPHVRDELSGQGAR